MRAPRWYRASGIARNFAACAGPELFVAATAVALYSRTLGYGFVFDDHSLIGPQGPIWHGGAWVPYRPLRYASLWIDHLLGGGAPWAYHLTNVLLHAGVAAGVVRLARRAGAFFLLAVAAGAFVAAHPLTVEAVAYVSGRRDLLAALLGTWAVAAWTNPRGRSALAVALVVLATAAKEIGLLFVPVLALASWCGLGPPLGRARRVLVPAALACVVLPAVYGAEGPLAPSGDVATKLTVAGALAWHYVERLAAGGGLSAAYPELVCLPADCANLRGLRASLGVGVLAGALFLFAAAYRCRWRSRAGAGASERDAWRVFSLGWASLWLAALAFVVGLHEPGADRHAYVLVVASALTLASWAATLRAPRAQFVAAGLLVAWAVVLAVRTDARIPIWKHDRALWNATVRSAPASVRAHYNLAAVLTEDGRPGRARRHLRRALTLDPEYWPAVLGLAGLDCAGGRIQAGQSRLAKAAEAGAPPERVAATAALCRHAAPRPQRGAESREPAGGNTR